MNMEKAKKDARVSPHSNLIGHHVKCVCYWFLGFSVLFHVCQCYHVFTM